MISNQSKEIQALVNDVRDGRLLLPELQRRFVWKSVQVRDLFDSLYHQYPSGQLLVWETDDLPYSHTLSLDELNADEKKPQLLLDGQQRMTSLAAIMLGTPLIVRANKRPIDIVFNVFSEKFDVASPRYTKDGGWISLTKLFTQGVLPVLRELNIDTSSSDADTVFSRLQRLENIKTYKYQVNILEKLTYDEVTHIFVRINSGGTKLNSADLALAQMSSRWRGITQTLTEYQNSVWKRKNKLWLDTGILLRAMSSLLVGQTRLSLLFRGERQKINLQDLEKVWKRVKTGMDMAIDFLISNCMMDRLDLLPTQYILIPLAVFFDKFGNNVTEEQIRDLTRWVYMALIWNRYSGASETGADQDVTAIKSDAPIANMIQNLEDKIGRNRPVTERELRDQRKNSPFMIISYVLARRANAQDWFNGVIIHGTQSLEFHHIFPKEVLREKYDLRANSYLIDQVANLAFLSKRANLKINSRPPSQYLQDVQEHRLRAQNIPMDSKLWELNTFEDFLQARREALATSINQMLQSLTDKPAMWMVSQANQLDNRINTIETILRSLVANRLNEVFGDDAWNHVPSQIRNTLDGRVAAHLQKHSYQAAIYEPFDAKLEFCQFSDYVKIITSNWQCFQGDFGNAQVFDGHIKNVTELRNMLKHGREIADHDLAVGEGGLLWLEQCLAQFELQEDEVDEDENGQDDEE